MSRKFISYKQSNISYLRSGSGLQPVICLHGFNEDACSFAVLENKNNRYAVFSIDAPFHGATQWREGLHYSPADLYAIIGIILKTEGFAPKEAFTLIGFSLGGRLALSFYEHYPQSIKQLVLIAPDGLKVNGWYWLAAHTSIGNRAFHFTMHHPGWFIRMAGLFSRLGIINTGVKKFVVQYLSQDAVRNILYKAWTAFRFLILIPGRSKKYSALQNAPAALFWGL